MNWKAMANNVGKLARVLPAPIGSFAKEVDAVWLIQAVNATERTMQLRYLPSDHIATLGSDAVHCWDENPAKPNSGYLRLKRQLIFNGCNLKYEPLPRRYWG